MSFTVEFKDKNTEARAGILDTVHGKVKTPAFMPVATKGTVKTIDPTELHEMGTEAIIANALHLHIRPGEESLERSGGLHQFMKWDGTIFTDSGGFQIIRDTFKIKITEDGLKFRNFYDGRMIHFSPEDCMQVQKSIGSDIAMLLDDCPLHSATPQKVKEATERTIRWAKRGIDKGRTLGIPLLFAIVQGGRDFELRKHCIENLEELGPDGYGIGGLSIGESKEEMIRILSETTHLIPEHKTRYLMGVGSVKELLDSISLGIDVFDSVLPTQCARHGTIFTSLGRYNMRGLKLEKDLRPLDENCECKICKTYTRSYINHLLREKEMLGMRLASYHNLYFILNVVRGARLAIQNGTFTEFKEANTRYKN